MGVTHFSGLDATTDGLWIGGVQVTATAAELNAVDVTTAGTVQASKAVVVDASKNAGDFNNLDCVNLDAGSSGAAGTVDVFPATASRGKLALTCTNQTGNTTVTLTPAAMGQATTVTIPDPGAATSYVAQSTAALTLAEVDVLDAVTAGTAAANKAAVLGANKNIDEFHTAKLYLGSAAGTEVSATAAELNELDGIVASFTIAYAAGGANVAEATITLKDAAGATVASPLPFMVWLSDAATGVGLTGTAASGTVQAKSASGADFGILTAKKALLVQPLATGIYILEITDTSKTKYYVCAATLDGRAYTAGAQMATASYGT